MREYVAHLGEKKLPGWSYKWTVNGGIIVHGQGTATIKVNAPEFETVTATVEIAGPRPECPRTASVTASCHRPGFFNPPVQESKQSPSARQRQVGSNARFTAGNSALNIPLEIDNNIILMQVGVNNSKPLRFIFDTGASHTVLHSRRGAELGLKPEGEELTGNATGGSIRGRMTLGVSLKVAGAEVSNQQIGLIDFPVPPGFEFDGVIGYDFINAFVVEIDYLKKIMNLYDPRTYSYRGRGEVIPLVMERRIPMAHVTITPPAGAPLNAVLGVDTGADRAFIFNNPFVKKHGLVEAMTNIKESVGRGAGGEQEIVIGRAKTAQLGRFVFTNPTVGLVRDPERDGAAKEGDGVIGGEIFRRFKVIIDYSRRRMILEPNHDLNDPYPVDPGE